MTYMVAAPIDDPKSLSKLPGWVTARSDETPQNVAFLSGAVFAMLDTILEQLGESIPKPLMQNTLALKAAVATSKLEGRMAREADIRDAYHLTPPDLDGTRHWGPDGDVLDFWRRAGRVRLTGNEWRLVIAEHCGDHEAAVTWVEDALSTTIRLGPLAGAIQIMKYVLEADSRSERLACFLSDIVIAKSFGWDHSLALTAVHLTKVDLRNLVDKESEAVIKVQSAIIKSAQGVFQTANRLAARAQALTAVAPKLRSRGSDDAVALFLTEDAVAPSGMLSPCIKGTRTEMTGRAARRLCDRLVELGVVKELTGRPTFRLYGVTP